MGFGGKRLLINYNKSNFIRFLFCSFKDGNGYIDEQELDALLKDLYEKNNKEVDSKSLTGYKQSIMALSDGGKLYRSELEIVLCRDPML
ncbi:calretinin-like [Danio aesculapii]|uniref:calretinin-like n=1 Tax=Danio aesculapii TaxID=1142201 RepID=UPI0024C047A4|nr:calretinin-like [Danio aesculapii]